MRNELEKKEFESLSARAAAGDRQAFTELVERSQKTVYRLAFRIVGNADEAADVVQETYVRAWQGLKTVRDHGAAYSWICRVARNVSYERFRGPRRREMLVLDAGIGESRTPLVEQLASDGQGPEQQLGSEELGAMVRKAMGKLKEKHRLVLSLREMDGMSYEEVATALGCSIGTVESRLHRARTALARKLKPLMREIGKEV